MMHHGTPDGKSLFELARKVRERRPLSASCLSRHSHVPVQRWEGAVVTHVQVTATHLCSASGRLELFAPDNVRTVDRFGAIDRINRRYGEFTLGPATLLQRSTMPNVIAPARRPGGHRQHIPD